MDSQPTEVFPGAPSGPEEALSTRGKDRGSLYKALACEQHSWAKWRKGSMELRTLGEAWRTVHWQSHLTRDPEEARRKCEKPTRVAHVPGLAGSLPT